MANVNKVVRRRQVALLIALVLGIALAVPGPMVSEMNLKKAPPAKAPKGEPAPDMTGVVNQSFDNKVQRSAIAEAQRLNKETQTEIKNCVPKWGLSVATLKAVRIAFVNWKTRTSCCRHSLRPGRILTLSVPNLCRGRWPLRGNLHPLVMFHPDQFLASRRRTGPGCAGDDPIQRPGMMDSQEFSLPDTGPKSPVSRGFLPAVLLKRSWWKGLMPMRPLPAIKIPPRCSCVSPAKFRCLTMKSSI